MGSGTYTFLEDVFPMVHGDFPQAALSVDWSVVAMEFLLEELHQSILLLHFLNDVRLPGNVKIVLTTHT